MVFHCDLRLKVRIEAFQIRKIKFIYGKALKEMSPLRNANESTNKFKMCNISPVLKGR